jgi:hypothetical protein
MKKMGTDDVGKLAREYISGYAYDEIREYLKKASAHVVLPNEEELAKEIGAIVAKSFVIPVTQDRIDKLLKDQMDEVDKIVHQVVNKVVDQNRKRAMGESSDQQHLEVDEEARKLFKEANGRLKDLFTKKAIWDVPPIQGAIDVLKKVGLNLVAGGMQLPDRPPKWGTTYMFPIGLDKKVGSQFKDTWFYMDVRRVEDEAGNAKANVVTCNIE